MMVFALVHTNQKGLFLRVPFSLCSFPMESFLCVVFPRYSLHIGYLAFQSMVIHFPFLFCAINSDLKSWDVQISSAITSFHLLLLFRMSLVSLLALHLLSSNILSYWEEIFCFMSSSLVQSSVFLVVCPWWYIHHLQRIHCSLSEWVVQWSKGYTSY